MYVGHSLTNSSLSHRPPGQHTFPHDYRSGPGIADWDPSKWVIITLAKLGVAWGLRRATPGDIAAARAHMLLHGHDHNSAPRKTIENEEWDQRVPTWTEAELKAYAEHNSACVLWIDGYAVDVTGYIEAHVRPPLFAPILGFVADGHGMV
jgi:stearoyl-CoA desaturase (delta-9 desaturase)